VLGILLVAAGFVGFLPILGFWMAPVGAVLIALDIPPLRRRLSRWIERHEDAAVGPKTIAAKDGPG
jgi:purine-cytosine permease-like protein